MQQDMNMRQQKENIDILFWKTSPEVVLENIRLFGAKIGKYSLKVDADKYSIETYKHFSQMNFSEYSPDEIELRYEHLQNTVNEKGFCDGIFKILYEYADNVLRLKGEELVCRLDKVLEWNSAVACVGQDIFTTAWMAHRDAENPSLCERKNTFVWPAILKTDDNRLHEILQRGLAENHFHLNGSTQSFPLSWACLMNHPEYIKKFFGREGRFTENLSIHITKGILDNVYDWPTRISYAAMIRALLFKKCLGIKSDADTPWTEFKKFDRLPILLTIKKNTELLRFAYGMKFDLKKNKKCCLDYAISSDCYEVQEEHYNRLLAGERNFLYQCFYNQFMGKFTLQESSLFYLYLLIKSNFRGELIQNNKRSGFTNFAYYQDRKNQFFGELEEYWYEAQRLAVCASIKENNIVSLEARIMPEQTALHMKHKIETEDKIVCETKILDGTKNFYYVIHFGKNKFTAKEFKDKKSLIPRNVDARNRAKKCAKALNEYIHRYDVKGQRIWGIDACSLEIGCRPEVFATEFRFLRGCSMKPQKQYWYKEKSMKHKELGITYHVGEDFLDIADGLRAIDEAMQFLEMKKGDRLGHALVLGIEPEEYYSYKKGEIYLTKQDYLDNLIWILYRTLELNIVLEGNQRVEMEEKARELLKEIYGDSMKITWAGDMLDMYYFSWFLRGDHPSLYASGEYKKSVKKKYDMYYKYMERNGSYEKYRRDSTISQFYYLYQYNQKVKLVGLLPEGFAVDTSYISLMKKLQQALRLEVVKKGIAIECNPTSNVLIGTFRNYNKHPILTFNHHILDNKSCAPNIQVSINTDDLGVFDTSLENEYALMMDAIIKMRHSEGNFEDDRVYEYLDYLRMNGMNMTFKNVCK